MLASLKLCNCGRHYNIIMMWTSDVWKFALGASRAAAFHGEQRKNREFLKMHELTESLERQGSSSRLGFLSSSLASLTRPAIAAWAPIPLRLIVGYGFMEHGFAKLFRGPEAFAAILHTIGVPAPHLMAWLTILTELIGGLAVLLGAFVPVVSLPMAAVLLVAMVTVHLPYGFSSIKLLSVTAGRAQFGPPGYELDLLYLACLAALVFGGSGPLAIDGYLRKK
jgi:putative oxidoreductase